MEMNGEAALTIEELKARIADDRAELARRAEIMRDSASQIVNSARDALENAEHEAQRLEAEADELDPGGAVVPEKPKRARRAKPPVAEPEAAEPEAPAEPKPTRKPRSEKIPGPKVTSNGKAPTFQDVIAVLGAEKMNKSQLANAGSFDRAALSEVIAQMLESKQLKGKGKGAGKRYWAA
jgi:hypothetical protein